MYSVLRYALVFVVGLGIGALGMAQTGEPGQALPVSGREGAVTSGGLTTPAVTDDLQAETPGPDITGRALTQIQEQLHAERSARQQLASDVAQLKDELNALQREVLASTASAADDLVAEPSTDPVDEAMARASEPTETMVALGVSPLIAADIKRRMDQADLARLTLRDQAAREGWLGTEKYFEELGKVEGNVQALRNELGDEVYDKFLYSMGQMNRVQVAGVLDGSVAAEAGIRANDTLFAYAGKRIFSWDELRAATTEGAIGEYVPVTVLRDGAPVEFLVPRGPLGIKLDATRLRP